MCKALMGSCLWWTQFRQKCPPTCQYWMELNLIREEFRGYGWEQMLANLQDSVRYSVIGAAVEILCMCIIDFLRTVCLPMSRVRFHHLVQEILNEHDWRGIRNREVSEKGELKRRLRDVVRTQVAFYSLGSGME